MRVGGELKVQPGDLGSTADWLDAVAQDITDAVDKQMRAVRDFLGTDWQGAAATSHEDPWTEWEAGAHRIIGSFGADAGALRRSAGTFVQVDRARATATDQAGSSLDLPPVL